MASIFKAIDSESGAAVVLKILWIGMISMSEAIPSFAQ